jgi:protein arginine kinase
MTWYIDQGPESDVIISSRVRLARNLDRYPFTHRMDQKQAKECAREIENAFFDADATRKKNYIVVDLSSLSEEERESLVEKRLISEDLANETKGGHAIISRDESLSLMINEEDHIRIQSMKAGFDLDASYQAAYQVAMSLEQSLSLAYSEQYGFLTACPTNTGTGMRASVMAHLPGLVQAGQIRSVLESLGKMGFAVRGLYGEHSKAEGNLFQISNQLTLGISEEDLLSDLRRMIQQLMEKERQARTMLYQKLTLELEDRVQRATAILSSARLMTNDEAQKLLSEVRLGVALGILPDVASPTLNRIASIIGPASIQKANGRQMNAHERDSARAVLIRDLMKV